MDEAARARVRRGENIGLTFVAVGALWIAVCCGGLSALPRKTTTPASATSSQAAAECEGKLSALRLAVIYAEQDVVDRGRAAEWPQRARNVADEAAWACRDGTVEQRALVTRTKDTMDAVIAELRR